MEAIRLEYSELLIRRTIKAYWWRQIGPVFFVVTVVMTALLIYLLAKGDRSWLVGLLGAVISLAVSIVTASYFVHMKRSLTKLRNMGKPEAMLELEDTRFRVTSELGSSDVQWSIIKQLWRYKDAWLIFFSAGEFMTLPTSNISANHKEFILSKLRQVGAKIV